MNWYHFLNQLELKPKHMPSRALCQLYQIHANFDWVPGLSESSAIGGVITLIFYHLVENWCDWPSDKCGFLSLSWKFLNLFCKEECSMTSHCALTLVSASISVKLCDNFKYIQQCKSYYPFYSTQNKHHWRHSIILQVILCGCLWSLFLLLLQKPTITEELKRKQKTSQVESVERD